jgi:hypothetical protein
LQLFGVIAGALTAARIQGICAPVEKPSIS